MSSIALYCYVYLCILSSTDDITQKNSESETVKSTKCFGKRYRRVSKPNGNTFSRLNYIIQSI